MYTSAANPNSDRPNLFNFDFPAPQPTLDADILKQLPFIPGLKEILMLRQVHALEHGTVWVLSQGQTPQHFPNTPHQRSFQVDNEQLGGLSTDEGFFLYGDVNTTILRRAVTVALHRLTSGEWDLAVHPRCGTNLSVTMFLTASFAVGMHLLLPRGPIEQLIGLGVAATTAAEIAPTVGTLAQRYLTTAIPFNLQIENIAPAKDMWGKEAHFVKVGWRQE
ncbi:DUF6391 domain-containing protein [Calothrix sp. 336/3]|uniref:DUF6391 domain-containing protein n=1 Tax=Calothrix sp. 336/3 TaxID=1337936 RepID=UPI0004E2A3B4|nr:DUF6391 domain-containing protein [Calothrix sp. 336/3]AKG21079.1 hypothetical protein IJ00_07015 [Calothrix sp. 336/3]